MSSSHFPKWCSHLTLAYQQTDITWLLHCCALDSSQWKATLIYFCLIFKREICHSVLHVHPKYTEHASWVTCLERTGIFSVFRKITAAWGCADEEHTDQLPQDYFWQFGQKLFDCASQLFQQMSGCLVSDVHADEEAKYGGPGLVWLHMVCWLVGCTKNFWEMMIILEVTKVAALAALSVKPCGKTAHFESGLSLWPFYTPVEQSCCVLMCHTCQVDWLSWQRSALQQRSHWTWVYLLSYAFITIT